MGRFAEYFRYFVEPVLFLSFMTMYMEVSLVQQLISRKICVIQEIPNCKTDGRSDALKAAASPWIGTYNIVLSSVTLVTGLWFGSWADKYGRKRMMIIPSIGSISSVLLFIISSYYMELTPVILLIASGLIGLSTGVLGVSSTCFGLVSDVTTTENRSTRIALMEAMIFTGGALGLYAVGFFLPLIGFVATFSFELVIHLCIFTYIVVAIREPERTRQLEISTSSAISFNHILSMFRTISRPRERNYRTTVTLLLCSSLMLSFGMAVTSSLTYTYLTKAPLHWTGSQYSFYHGLMVAIQGCAIVVALPVCLRFFRMKDTTSGILGSLSRMIGLGWFSIANKSWMVYLTLVFLSMSEFAIPSIRSILSKIVGPNEKAQIFAFMSAQQSFSFLMASLFLLDSTNALSAALFPGFGFALASAFNIVPVAALIYISCTLETDIHSPPLCNVEENARYQSADDVVPVP